MIPLFTVCHQIHAYISARAVDGLPVPVSDYTAVLPAALPIVRNPLFLHMFMEGLPCVPPSARAHPTQFALCTAYIRQYIVSAVTRLPQTQLARLGLTPADVQQGGSVVEEAVLHFGSLCAQVAGAMLRSGLHVIPAAAAGIGHPAASEGKGVVSGCNRGGGRVGDGSVAAGGAESSGGCAPAATAGGAAVPTSESSPSPASSRGEAASAVPLPPPQAATSESPASIVARAVLDASTCPLRHAGPALFFLHRAMFDHAVARLVLLAGGAPGVSLPGRVARCTSVLTLPFGRIQDQPGVLGMLADVWRHTFGRDSDVGRTREALLGVIAASAVARQRTTPMTPAVAAAGGPSTGSEPEAHCTSPGGTQVRRMCFGLCS